ncbi:Bifunctional protein Aas [Vibrio stylophorae]|uniref:Bifunctional protein Aas n=1 Tax=Vibrio stylophorae TaxID=659351 RepID=A0ABN8DX54_9VIBR|nr:lysophospholipid acyltransferase family protein [Vibrio stylophorae]CAH0533967.1 Bifunctional protein Aas [Vibrio stylophorae]
MHKLIRGLDKLWRIVGTGISFTMFGLGALLLTFFIFPLLTCRLRDPMAREVKVQQIISRAFRFFIGFMRTFHVIDCTIEGEATLAQDKGCLVIANHPSLIDYVMLASVMPQCDCIVKAAIWHNPFIRGIVRAAGYIPNISPEDLLKRCEQRLALGHRILIFPEGTRTTPGEAMTLQRGAAQIAARTGCDMRVVHITCRPSSLTKQEKWYQVPETISLFHVVVQEKISVAPFLADAPSEAAAARRINRHLMTALLPKH